MYTDSDKGHGEFGWKSRTNLDNTFTRRTTMKTVHWSFKGSLKATAACAMALVGLALSSMPAAAQATYLYTGKPFTLAVSSLPPSRYNTSDRITVTLVLNDWLLPGLDHRDVTQLPGFRMIISDGVTTLDTANLPPALTDHTTIATVSTDARGAITGWTMDETAGSITGYYTEHTSDQPATFAPPLAPANDYGAFGAVRFLDVGESYEPGSWSFPQAPDLVSMLLNQIQLGILPDIGHSLADQLQQVLTDIRTNNGQACQDLQAFVNHVKAQTGKKISAANSALILQTVAIIQSELACRG
jgi:hypothetical protein